MGGGGGGGGGGGEERFEGSRNSGGGGGEEEVLSIENCVAIEDPIIWGDFPPKPSGVCASHACTSSTYLGVIQTCLNFTEFEHEKV